MKKFLCTCGLLAVMLALAAGIYYLFWYSGKKDLGDVGTLVRNFCQESAKEWKV